MFAERWCDFLHKSMRTRSIFDIIDYLNRAHFELQNKSSIESSTYCVQMLLRYELHEIAKQLRNVELRNLIRFSSNSEAASNRIFFKKISNLSCWKMIRLLMSLISLNLIKIRMNFIQSLIVWLLIWITIWF